MIAPHDLRQSSSQRPLRLRLRGDVEICRQTFQGHTYWMVKDPLTLRYFRFEDEEFAILRMIDGRSSPAEIQRNFEERFVPQRLPLTHLESLIARLFQQALLVSDAPAQGERLHERFQRRRWQERRAAYSNILCVQLPGVNPDGLLAWLNRYVGWMFSGPCVVASGLLILAACLLVAVQFDLFLRRLPEFHQFFGLHNWLLLAAVLSGTKVLHEFGHGLACKRFGGECHELGLMFLVLTPCLYCNVSDSWMIPSKWRRAGIGAAGMYVELVLAALCTFLWWFSEVGWLHYLCLNVMFVCSVSTLLFNANPLMRYDGYFLFADLLEIPNLRQKASAILARWLGRCVTGVARPADPFLPTRHRGVFAVYALAAAVYRWIVAAAILVFLYRVLEPYGLKIVSQLLVALSLYGLALRPLVQLATWLRVPGRTRHVEKLRVAGFLCLLAAVLAVAAWMPLPYYIACAVQVQPQDAASVYVDVAGTLVSLHVRPDEHVRRGQVLATLRNTDLELSTLRLQGEHAQLTARLTALQLQAYTDEKALLEMSEVSEAIAALDQHLQRQQEDLQRLTITAPCDGVVFAAQPLPPADDSERLPAWTGHPLQPDNVSAVLQEGVTICQIGDPRQWEAILEIDEHAMEFVQAGQSVTLCLEQRRGEQLTGHIAQVSRTETRLTPTGFSDPRVHDQPRPVSARSRLPRLSPTYQASVPLPPGDGIVLAGGRGQAWIRVGYRSAGQRLWDALCRTFHFEM
ncbi:MAG: HlyD family efflux transporter periplasmic adaptor subunit [Pirellulaceae bacterium]